MQHSSFCRAAHCDAICSSRQLLLLLRPSAGRRTQVCVTFLRVVCLFVACLFASNTDSMNFYRMTGFEYVNELVRNTWLKRARTQLTDGRSSRRCCVKVCCRARALLVLARMYVRAEALKPRAQMLESLLASNKASTKGRVKRTKALHNSFDASKLRQQIASERSVRRTCDCCQLHMPRWPPLDLETAAIRKAALHARGDKCRLRATLTFAASSSNAASFDELATRIHRTSE